MKKYILKRLLQLIPVLFGVTFLSFALIYSVSGDAVDMLYENVGGAVSDEVKEAMRQKLGLNRSFLGQYGDWLMGVLKGDMGMSYISGKPVFKTFINKLPNTIYLAVSSIVVTVFISILLGIAAAVRQNKFIDYLIRFFSFVGNAMPGFFVSLLLILIFSVKLKWFLVVGDTGFRSIILPTCTLSIAMSAKYIRQVRMVVLEELSKDYVTGARARGVSESAILFNNVLKSAMITIVTLIAMSLGSLLGGTAIVESIFLWDGVGKWAVDSIIMRDYPAILAYVVWMAIIYVAVNLVSDILYHILDPRVSLGGREDN